MRSLTLRDAVNFSGLGCLLIRNGSEHILQKKLYFGGGTVTAAFHDTDFRAFKSSVSARLEDGTAHFLGIVALRHGLQAMKDIAGSMGRVQQHTFALAREFASHLQALRHENGHRVAEVYGNHDADSSVRTQGSIVTFNLLDPSGNYIGSSEVEKIAATHNIQLRTGCFCNPGACAVYLKQTTADQREAFEAGHVCGDTIDLHNGKPTGAVRVSFGWCNIPKDFQELLKVIDLYFVQTSKEKSPPTPTRRKRKVSQVASASKERPSRSKLRNIDSAATRREIETDVPDRIKIVYPRDGPFFDVVEDVVGIYEYV